MKSAEPIALHRLSPYHGLALFLLALLPRMTGLITFENPDEGWGASVRVLTGDLIGGTSQTLPLVNYLNAASFVILYAVGRLVGVWHGTADFRAQYFIDRTPFVFSGRFVAACLGALSAPVAALIASRLGLTRRSSLIVGTMVAILPASVLQSHVAKPDSGVALAILLLAWSLLRKLDNPAAKSGDVLVGLAVAIAASFKQTALFLVAPALIGFVALLRWNCRLPWSQIVRGALVSLLACIVAWIPMNIGILLDPRSFLAYQRATAIMMTREANAYQIAQYVIPLLAGSISGLTAAGILAWLIAPLVRRDPRFLNLWVSTVFAYVIFSAISGGVKVEARYLLPYNALAFTLGCIAALSLTERERRARAFGWLLTIAILAFEGFGFVEVVKQAMATPMSVRCSEVLKSIADPEHDRILAAAPHLIGLPIDRAASEEEHQRHERLAKKYGVTLPDRADEKKSHRYQTERGYYVRSFPFAMGGMEDLKSEVAERAVKPFWWPIQQEEWDLDYWTKQGFDIFVVKEESAVENSGIPEYQSLYRQIKQRCEQVAVLPSRRRLFHEGEVKIYRLRDPGTPAPRTGPGSHHAR